MGGLILLAVVAVWMAACIYAAAWLMRRLPLKRLRTSLAISIFTLLFALPVADELVARRQFIALCGKGAVVKIDAEKIRGKIVRLDISPANRLVEGTFIPIRNSHYSFRDVVTNEELAHYDVYLAEGGFASRWTKFPEGHHPWTIPTARCSPPQSSQAIAREFGFMLTN